MSSTESAPSGLCDVDVLWLWGRGLVPPVCGCSIVPVKEHLVDGSSPIYHAVQTADKDLDLDGRGRRSTNLQSKSFRVLAHMTGTESSKFPIVSVVVDLSSSNLLMAQSPGSGVQNRVSAPPLSSFALSVFSVTVQGQKEVEEEDVCWRSR